LSGRPPNALRRGYTAQKQFDYIIYNKRGGLIEGWPVFRGGSRPKLYKSIFIKGLLPEDIYVSIAECAAPQLYCGDEDMI